MRGPRGRCQLIVPAIGGNSRCAEGRHTPCASHRLKRIFDLVAASMLSLAFCPVVVLLTVLLRVTLGRLVIFSQVRIGLHGSTFQVYKFRTRSEEHTSELQS